MFSYSIFRHVNQVHRTCIRFKNPPDHWSVLRKKVKPTNKALDHFDDFYKQVFNKKWGSIREGLLRKQKYVAVINNYGDNEETMSKLELQGALNLRTLFRLEKEHIRESLENNRRKSQLEKIWKMDKDLKDSQQRLEASENSAQNDMKNDMDPKKFSMEHSLKTAEFDTRRIVDSQNALSSEILNEFIPATKIKGKEDFIPESSHYKMYDTKSQFSVKIEREHDIHFPEHLNVYCYEMDNFSDFPSPKKGSTGVLNYYLMDGGSVLPVLALDIRPGHKILDMCASPGGKSLLAIQTLYPDCVVSNDVSNSRINRIENVYEEYLYDLKERWLDTGRIRLTNCDGRDITEQNFDRVLVDVPCTTDRHSLKENDNNLFKPSRIKERLKLPEIQSELLFHALNLVKKGGIVVYSTCSLSPIQNDGVVQMVLKRIWEETHSEIVVKDLSTALLQTKHVYQLADQSLLKYGHLVLPCKTQNYGPTYFCKLQKIK